MKSLANKSHKRLPQPSPQPKARKQNRGATADSVLSLQQRLGNQAVGRMLQAKLKVNTPGDKYEQEADRVAEQMMRMDESSASTPAAAPHAEDSGKPASSLNAQTGEPLNPEAQKFFEPRFGQDFSQVRVHPESESARKLQARAYTMGNDIIFAPGEYRPADKASRNLLAHELAHTIQQSTSAGPQAIQRKPSDEKKGGLGRSAPEELFIKAKGLGAEKGHVLFKQDSASLGPAEQKMILDMLAPHKDAVTIDLHGYASAEGNQEYNLNLSAHRAAAVKMFLKEHAPAGSKINLFARGETNAFGALAQNRRVGIDVIAEAPASVTGKHKSDRPLRTPSLEPALTSGPILTPLRTPDWGALREPFTSHGLRLGERDIKEVEKNWARSFELFRAILPPDKAASAASKATAFAYEKQLAMDQPNVLDNLREQESRLGGAAPTVIVPILTPGTIDWATEKAKKLFAK